MIVNFQSATDGIDVSLHWRNNNRIPFQKNAVYMQLNFFRFNVTFSYYYTYSIINTL